MTYTNKSWRLRKRPEGEIKESDLELVESEVPALEEGQVLIRNTYISVDPTNRIWMSDRVQYMPPVEIGDVMRAGSIGVIAESRHPDFQQGDIANPGLGGWELYTTVDGAIASKMPSDAGIPMTAFMSGLGMTGATAYFGLLNITDPQPGETLVVSAAAGAVGSIVGQIGKIKGCRVIGIAGSDEKCKHIVDDFGFDGAINYKTEDVNARLGELCPDGIDINFENVGGQILDDILEHVNLNARISLCGMISVYNEDGKVPGPYNFDRILMQRVKLEGFIVSDFLADWPAALAELGGWIMEGKIKYDVDVVEGIENMLPALDRLFTGANMGKQLVRVSEDPTES